MMTAEEEAERLRTWHLAHFHELGFSRIQSDILELAHADWRDAEELIDHGCTHELVLEILT